MWTRLLAAAKQRAKKKRLTFDITLQDLQKMWHDQEGKCFWFGVYMDQNVPSRDPFLPSLDRLDCKKGYTADNVVLTCWAANAAKQDSSLERWQELLDGLEPRKD